MTVLDWIVPYDDLLKCDTEAPFRFELNGIVSSKLYDKRDDLKH